MQNMTINGIPSAQIASEPKKAEKAPEKGGWLSRISRVVRNTVGNLFGAKDSAGKREMEQWHEMQKKEVLKAQQKLADASLYRAAAPKTARATALLQSVLRLNAVGTPKDAYTVSLNQQTDGRPKPVREMHSKFYGDAERKETQHMHFMEQATLPTTKFHYSMIAAKPLNSGDAIPQYPTGQVVDNFLIRARTDHDRAAKEGVEMMMKDVTDKQPMNAQDAFWASL